MNVLYRKSSSIGKYICYVTISWLICGWKILQVSIGVSQLHYFSDQIYVKFSIQDRILFQTYILLQTSFVVPLHHSTYNLYLKALLILLCISHIFSVFIPKKILFNVPPRITSEVNPCRTSFFKCICYNSERSCLSCEENIKFLFVDTLMKSLCKITLIYLKRA